MVVVIGSLHFLGRYPLLTGGCRSPTPIPALHRVGYPIRSNLAVVLLRLVVLLHFADSLDGTLVLRTLTEKMTIYLGNFEPVERLWLIRYFRNAAPMPLQEGWPLFCSKIALPLRDRDALLHGDPGPDSVRITRRRWDWYCVPFILLMAVFGFAASWRLQQPRMLVAPLLPAFLWLMLRTVTPREGMAAKRITSEPGMTNFLVFELFWFGVAVAGLVVFKIWNPPMPVAAITAGIALVLWLGVLLWQACRLDRQRRERDEANASVAVGQWDEGEAAGMADGGG